MKAKIDGIEIEGTPSEIAEFKFKLDEQSVSHGLAKLKFNKYVYSTPTIIGDPPPGNPLEWNKITCNMTDCCSDCCC